MKYDINNFKQALDWLEEGKKVTSKSLGEHIKYLELHFITRRFYIDDWEHRFEFNKEQFRATDWKIYTGDNISKKQFEQNYMKRKNWTREQFEKYLKDTDLAVMKCIDCECDKCKGWKIEGVENK